MESYELPNEETLLVLSTVYNYKSIGKRIKDMIDFDKISGDRLLYMLNTNYYKVRSLFYYNLKKYEVYNKLPDEVKTFLDKECKLAKEKFFIKQKEVQYIVKQLLNNEVKIVVLKGIGLAETVYNEKPWIRDFNDIDILAEEEKADGIYNYLIKNLKYICNASQGEQRVYKEFFQHYAPVFNDGICVELHHRLTQKNDLYRINTNRIIKKACKLDIDGQTIYIPDKEDMLISLCYHLYQHEYRETRYQLKCYSDIFNFLIHYQNKFKWSVFLEQVRVDKLEFPIMYSLYHVNNLYNNILDTRIVPNQVLENLRQDDFNSKKDAIVSRHLFNNDEPIGYWNCSHIERLFTDTKILRGELCKKYFFYTCQKEWEQECEKMNIQYEDNFEFTPKAWEKRGRI